MIGLKKIVRNFLSISLLQAINYLVPVFVLSIVIKKIGLANFGLSNYVLTAFMTVKIFIDYGYNLSGVKEIAENREYPDKISEIFSRVLFTKLYLVGFFLMLLLLSIVLFTPLRENSYLLLLSFTVVIGQSLVPLWFFQAMEKSEVLVVFSILTRGIYFFLVFKYIQQPADYIFLNLFLGIADILLAGMSLLYLVFRYKIKFRALTLKRFYAELKNNLHFAQGNILVTITFTVPFLALGLFADKITLGYYGIADKILQVLRTSASILHSAIFPRAIQLYALSLDAFKLFAKKILIFILGFYLLLFGVCFFASYLLVSAITNGAEVHTETIVALKIFSIIPLLAGLDIIPTHILIIANKQKRYVRILSIACVCSIAIGYVLGYIFSYIGTAVTCLIVEVLIFAMLAKSAYAEIQKKAVSFTAVTN